MTQTDRKVLIGDNSGKYVSVTEEIARRSTVIAGLLEDVETSIVDIPFYRYQPRLKDIELAFFYTERYLDDPVPTLFPFYDSWEQEWAANFDRGDLLLLCCLAEYLGLDRLYTVLSHIIADYDCDFVMAWRRDHPCPADASFEWGAEDFYQQKLARYKWWNRECEIDFDQESARQEYRLVYCKVL